MFSLSFGWIDEYFVRANPSIDTTLSACGVVTNANILHKYLFPIFHIHHFVKKKLWLIESNEKKQIKSRTSCFVVHHVINTVKDYTLTNKYICH